jgi:hypothetical protein
MTTSITWRMNVNDGIDAHFKETGVANQPRQLAADEEIDPVRFGVAAFCLSG